MQVADEFAKHRVVLLLACCNVGVRSKFPCNRKSGRIDRARNIFITIHDAVLAATESPDIHVGKGNGLQAVDNK